MTSLATAKVLLFIALSVGPRPPEGVIYATNQSENYVFTQDTRGWDLDTLNMPADDWECHGPQAAPSSYDQREFRAIARHRWMDGASMDLRDGSRIERQNGVVFYIQNPGAPNQKVFTIEFPRD